MSYEKIVQFCKENWQQSCVKNKEICDGLLGNTFVFNMPWDMEAVEEPIHFEKDIDWLYKPGKDMEFVFQFNRHRFLINLAQEYYLSGEERYLSKLLELVNHWIDNMPLSKDKTHSTAWRSLEVGLRAMTWLHAFHIIKDSPLVTDAFVKKFNNSLREHENFLLNVKDDRYYLSNWGVIQNHGLFAIACHFGEKDLSKGTLSVAFDKLYKQSKVQILDDGMQWEQSPMYHTEVLNCFLDVVIVAERTGIVLPKDFIDTVRQMAHVLIKWIKPDGCQPLLGDSDNTHLADILCKASMSLQDGLCKFKATEVLDFESIWMFGIEGIEKYNAIKIEKPQFLNAFLEDSGNYILRENWDSDSNYLHFINGYTGGGHAHTDKLHFDLCIDGRDILTDSGRYTYVGTDPLRHLLKAPKSHNTTTINNKNFIKNDISGWAILKYAPAVKCPVIDCDEYTILQGKHLGYLQMFGGGVVGRTIIWLKPDIYIVCDEFNLKGINSVQRCLNFAPDCSVEILDKEIVAKTGNVATTIKFLDKKTKLKKEKSYYSHKYNSLGENLRVKDSYTGVGDIARVFVVCGHSNASVVSRDVYANGRRLGEKKAHGFSIKVGADNYDFIICHYEIGSFVKFDEEIGGAGKILIFKNGKKLGFYW